jgi:hypothetical protein
MFAVREFVREWKILEESLFASFGLLTFHEEVIVHTSTGETLTPPSTPAIRESSGLADGIIQVPDLLPHIEKELVSLQLMDSQYNFPTPALSASHPISSVPSAYPSPSHTPALRESSGSTDGIVQVPELLPQLEKELVSLQQIESPYNFPIPTLPTPLSPHPILSSHSTPSSSYPSPSPSPSHTPSLRESSGSSTTTIQIPEFLRESISLQRAESPYIFPAPLPTPPSSHPIPSSSYLQYPSPSPSPPPSNTSVLQREPASLPGVEVNFEKEFERELQKAEAHVARELSLQRAENP